MIVDGGKWDEVEQYRKCERVRLIAARMALSSTLREAHALRMMEVLEGATEAQPGRIISGFTPYRGEPDIRPWMRQMVEKGVRICLPVVTARHQPLEFRLWTPGSRMERGVLGILIPAEGEVVVPDVTLAPLVGFDLEGYRLGHGGGYFDRTLATLQDRPLLVVGIGYSFTQIDTIYPQAHDIKMDRIVTEQGVRGVG